MTYINITAKIEANRSTTDMGVLTLLLRKFCKYYPSLGELDKLSNQLYALLADEDVHSNYETISNYLKNLYRPSCNDYPALVTISEVVHLKPTRKDATDPFRRLMIKPAEEVVILWLSFMRIDFGKQIQISIDYSECPINRSAQGMAIELGIENHRSKNMLRKGVHSQSFGSFMDGLEITNVVNV